MRREGNVFPVGDVLADAVAQDVVDLLAGQALDLGELQAGVVGPDPADGLDRVRGVQVAVGQPPADLEVDALELVEVVAHGDNGGGGQAGLVLAQQPVVAVLVDDDGALGDEPVQDPELPVLEFVLGVVSQKLGVQGDAVAAQGGKLGVL